MCYSLFSIWYQTWLWIGVACMALGATFFGFGSHNAKTEGWRKLYTLSFFICLIASALYLATALGQGQSIVYGRPTVWVRYITWSLSTPLLLLIFAFLGRTSLTLTGSLLGANAFMIATGLVATLSPKPINYIWSKYRTKVVGIAQSRTHWTRMD
ncbi:bacteriorhodopsin [Leptolyngbya sp. Cla-17]|uniref:bacteriorhodopsin n=1 Tax=Leptolyngbya sp. Cla-17 TaxID=2803751 RepID=UPI0027DDA3FA|nr:bacteriorhodopsin [Leptolyngbya sp. Cla-17]